MPRVAWLGLPPPRGPRPSRLLSPTARVAWRSSFQRAYDEPSARMCSSLLLLLHAAGWLVTTHMRAHSSIG